MGTKQADIPRYPSAEEYFRSLKPEEQKEIFQKHGQIYAGHEIREGWTGFHPFYVFRCRKCKLIVKNYPQGFAGEQKLYCPNCKTRHEFYRAEENNT